MKENLKLLFKDVNFILLPQREFTPSEILGATFLKTMFPHLEFTFCEKEIPQVDFQQLFPEKNSVASTIWNIYMYDIFSYIYSNDFATIVSTSFIKNVESSFSNNDRTIVSENPRVCLLFTLTQRFNNFKNFSINSFYILIEIVLKLFYSEVNLLSHKSGYYD